MQRMMRGLRVTFDGTPIEPLILGDRKRFSQFSLFSTKKILSVEEHNQFRYHALFYDTLPIDDKHRYSLYTLVHLGFADFFGIWEYRTSEYAFYLKDNKKPFGSAISWMEQLPDSRMLVVTLNIPELLVGGVPLRECHGIGIVKDISKLVLRLEDFDRKMIRYSVSFPSGFDPAGLEVLDTFHYSGKNISPRRLYMDGIDGFENGADGWHGSLVCFYPDSYNWPSYLKANLKWMDEVGVGVASRT